MELAYSAAASREIDARAQAILADADGYGLMQRAGAAVFRHIRQCYPEAQRLAVICGGGNNGGDGFVIAKLAQDAGLQADVHCLRETKDYIGAAAKAVALWQAQGGEPKPLPAVLTGCDLIVDAMLGTGPDTDLHPPLREIVTRINQHAAPIVAVDLPTGLHADTGRVLGVAVRAHSTMMLLSRKQGAYTGQGRAFTGTLVFDRIAAPDAAFESVPGVALSDAASVRQRLPSRSPSAHKGDAGHVLVIGGNTGMQGAPVLAALAALRSGAGKVTIGMRKPPSALAALQPELMVRQVSQAAELDPLLQRTDVVALGPGLGQDTWASAVCERVVACPLPQVLDADALNWLAGQSHSLATNAMLTPHPTEAGRLLGCQAADVEHDRFAAIDQLVERYRANVVLKGAGTLVAGGDRRWLAPNGNAGMAVGGSGDALTGVVAALIAQGMTLPDAAWCGAWLHAHAGDLAAGEQPIGMLPSDLINHLRQAINGR